MSCYLVFDKSPFKKENMGNNSSQIDKHVYFVDYIRSTKKSSLISIFKKVDGEIGTKMVDKNKIENRIFVVEVRMEGRTPEDIARDAVQQIGAIFDKLVEKQNEKKIEK